MTFPDGAGYPPKSLRHTKSLLPEVQYAFGDGPCLCAIRTGMAVLIPDLAKEDRWPGFTAAVTDGGYGAMLAVPVPVDGNDRASLNFYARNPHTFSGDAMVTAGGFAQIAATTLSLAAGLERHLGSSEAVQVRFPVQGSGEQFGECFVVVHHQYACAPGGFFRHDGPPVLHTKGSRQRAVIK
jgi:GAF domain-containing protein